MCVVMIMDIRVLDPTPRKPFRKAMVGVFSVAAIAMLGWVALMAADAMNDRQKHRVVVIIKKIFDRLTGWDHHPGDGPDIIPGA